jgi:hypothetical protein
MKQPNIWIHDVLAALTGATTVSSATWLQAVSGFSPSEARQRRDRVRRQELRWFEWKRQRCSGQMARIGSRVPRLIKGRQFTTLFVQFFGRFLLGHPGTISFQLRYFLALTGRLPAPQPSAPCYSLFIQRRSLTLQARIQY